MNKTLVLTSAIAAAVLGFQADAADNPKSQYHILNPTPKDQMREMVSDQYTYTLSPRTVDAGHFQLELDFVDYYYGKEDFGGGQTLKTEGWSFAPFTLKAGLCNNADLEVGWIPHTQISQSLIPGPGRVFERGIENVMVALKINIWGNDEGTTALGVVPFATFPTTTLVPNYKDYTGGVYVPFSAELPYELRLRLMTGVEIYEDAGDDLRPIIPASIALERTVTGNLGAFVEQDDWQGLVTGGLTYKLNEDILFHAGCSFGVHNAIDFNPFVGMSWRL
jgi:hypothetical protein